MDKTARPSARSNRCPRPISGRPAGVKMFAGYWILVPKSGTSNVRQSMGLCFRNRASASGTTARSIIAAARQADAHMGMHPAMRKHRQFNTWFNGLGRSTSSRTNWADRSVTAAPPHPPGQVFLPPEHPWVQEQCCAKILNWWIGSSTCSKCLLIMLTEAVLSRLGICPRSQPFSPLLLLS
jgi:hypothetical protein